MENFRIRAIRFEQNDRVFYVSVMPARELIERSEVHVWSADESEDEAGYQRAPSRTRLRQVANFVESDDAILPQGGLLNARSEGESAYGQVLEFQPDGDANGEGINAGWLTIAEHALPLYIVDMQHRLGGIEYAMTQDGREELGDFPVVVTIADGLSKVEEVEQFELINTTQKKVRTDLARRLMAIQAKDSDRRKEIAGRGRLWEARGPVVTSWLMKNGEIWKGRIIPPNKSKREVPGAVVRETSFVTSMKPILQSPLFQRMQDDTSVAALIDRYWQAIARVFPAAFRHPAEYVIQKTPGVFSLHQLFPEVVELVRTNQGDKFTVDNMEEAIQSWRQLGDEYWEAENDDGAAKYGSMKGFSRLAAELKELLPPLEFELT